MASRVRRESTRTTGESVPAPDATTREERRDDEAWEESFDRETLAKLNKLFLEFGDLATERRAISADQRAESFSRSRSAFDEVLSEFRTHAANLNNVALQATQNAVETANMVAKRAMDSHDLAQDRKWNIDEVSRLSTDADVNTSAIRSVILEVLAEMAKTAAK